MRNVFGPAIVGAAIAFLGCAGHRDDGQSAGEQRLTGASPPPITLQNWVEHPAIVAVRREVDAIDAAPLSLRTKELCDGASAGEFERVKSTDASGKIRRLVLEAGSGDSAIVSTYDYDASGKLRFVFETDKNVLGESSEMRVYFDETGKRVWDVFRHAADLEHRAPDISKAPFEKPETPLDVGPELSDPAKVFDGPPHCEGESR